MTGRKSAGGVRVWRRFASAALLLPTSKPWWSAPVRQDARGGESTGHSPSSLRGQVDAPSKTMTMSALSTFDSGMATSFAARTQNALRDTIERDGAGSCDRGGSGVADLEEGRDTASHPVVGAPVTGSGPDSSLPSPAEGMGGVGDGTGSRSTGIPPAFRWPGRLGGGTATVGTGRFGLRVVGRAREGSGGAT